MGNTQTLTSNSTETTQSTIIAAMKHSSLNESGIAIRLVILITHFRATPDI